MCPVANPLAQNRVNYLARADHARDQVTNRAHMRGSAACCDFTQFFAASALIILPQKARFKHEVGNEKEEILRYPPSYHCREFKKEA